MSWAARGSVTGTVPCHLNFEFMIPFFNRIKLSLAYIGKKACTWTAAIYTIAGLLSLFVSFEGIFAKDATFFCKFLIAAALLFGVWLICAITIAIMVGFQRKKKVVEGRNGKAVYVLYGDLFDPEIVDNSKRYICFVVNRCFDTVVDNRLISSTSVHGIAFNKLYQQNLTTPDALNTKIQGAIKGNPTFDMIDQTSKPKGNLKRYEVGTYANLSIDANLNYLLLGLTWFDSNLNAWSSKLDYVLCVQKMIEAFDLESQGYPVLLPIIGTGRSRTNLQEREALEYMIAAFRMNQRKISSDLYIVIYESAKNRISIADL